MRYLIWAVPLLIMATAGSRAAKMADPAQYVWKSRVLLLFAGSESDPTLAAQRKAVAAQEPGMQDRDLVVLTSLGDDPASQALRRRYDVVSPGFNALLIGKDGGVKLRSAQPIAPEQLFSSIDAMPMRRSETRGR